MKREVQDTFDTDTAATESRPRLHVCVGDRPEQHHSHVTSGASVHAPAHTSHSTMGTTAAKTTTTMESSAHLSGGGGGSERLKGNQKN